MEIGVRPGFSVPGLPSGGNWGQTRVSRTRPTLGNPGLTPISAFDRAAQLTGLVLTKLDGTAKGGIAVAIVSALKVPIRFVGLGEAIDDLVPFDAASFAEGLLG